MNLNADINIKFNHSSMFLNNSEYNLYILKQNKSGFDHICVRLIMYFIYLT